jgi:hypothetical protein
MESDSELRKTALAGCQWHGIDGGKQQGLIDIPWVGERFETPEDSTGRMPVARALVDAFCEAM